MLTIIAFGVTWVMSRFVRIMDNPNHRSSHTNPVPRAGGVSIVITFYIGVLITWCLGEFRGVDGDLLLGFMFSTFLVAGISLIDDITDQSARVKLVTQALAVIVALHMGVVLDQVAVPGFGYVQLGALGFLVSFFWIIGLTNAYNFMDGLDGLAGGVAVIVCLFFLVITFSEGSTFAYIISYSVLAGALGFSILNYPPAKIILGDVGAAFLGFLFASLAILASRYDESRVSFLVIPLLLFNVIYDTSFTFIRRLFSGEKVFEAHRGHLYQILNRSGYSHLEVVLIQYSMVFLQGIGALLMVRVQGDERMLVFIPYLLMQVVYTVLVVRFAQRKGVTFLIASPLSMKTKAKAKTIPDTMNNDPNHEGWPFFGEQERAAVSDVLASGKVNYRTGGHGRQFEQEFAKSMGCEYGVALANGSVSLELALIALGIGEGDEVIVPSYTFIASASSVVLRGATPIFADVDPDTINISASSIREKISERTKAIIAVHLLGCPCDMDAILAIAKEFNIHVIEDCAQAHGASYRGKPVGSFGDVAAFSFCQDKIMSTGGEGGMLTTNSKELREKAWSFKDHGKNRRLVEGQGSSGFSWVHDSFGTNWRMTEMQAVIGRLQLEKLGDWVLIRQRNASIMDNLLLGREGIKLPVSDNVHGHAYYKYTIQVDPKYVRQGWNRDRIIASLNDSAVPCASGICPEVYMENAFRDGGYFDGKRLPVAREIGERAIQFQVHPTISEATMDKRGRSVADLLDRILK